MKDKKRLAVIGILEGWKTTDWVPLKENKGIKPN
jgi:hypothetical protein